MALFVDAGMDFEQSKPAVEVEADGPCNHNDTGDQGKSGKGKGKGKQMLVGNSSVMVGNYLVASWLGPCDG